MPLNQEQTQQIKEQLLKQISNLPLEQQEKAGQQINNMTNEQIEKFLIQKQKEIQKSSQGVGCVFCSILEGKISSYKIDEDRDNIAILEINPLSKGHTLIIAKTHAIQEKIPSSSFTLAKKIAKKLKSKFKPKQIKIQSIEIFGHGIIEVLPVYGNEKERKKASEEELKKLQEQLKSKPKQPKAPLKERKPATLFKIKPRIP